MPQSTRHPSGASRPIGTSGSVEGALAPLDTYTKFAAQTSLEGESPSLRSERLKREARLDDRSAASTLERYGLQSAARRLLPLPWRVAFCLRYLKPDYTHVSLLRSEYRRSGRFGNVEVCGSVWVCPICSPHVAEFRRADVARAIAVHRRREGAVYLITRTVRHCRLDRLEDSLGAFKAAERRMTNTGAYKRLLASLGGVGAITALEVTYGDGSGWHPHTHTLLFLRQPVASVPALAADLYRRWAAAATVENLTTDPKGFKVQATYGAVDDYVAKWGRGPVDGRPWGVEDELTKQHTKRGRGGRRFAPFGLLARYYHEGDEQAGARFVEFANVFKGRSQLRWSTGLRSALLPGDVELDDEAAAATIPADYSEWGFLDFEDWRAVDRANKRGELANLVGADDREGVRSLVAECHRLHWVNVGHTAPGFDMRDPVYRDRTLEKWGLGDRDGGALPPAAVGAIAYNDQEGLAWF